MWSRPHDPIQSLDVDSTEFTHQLAAATTGTPSISIRRWLALVQIANEIELPSIRDYPSIEPLARHFPDAQQAPSTTILISGEGDMFWAVRDKDLCRKDPPVSVYQSYDRDLPSLQGHVSSVSQFVMNYLLACNTRAEKPAGWFTADGPPRQIEEASDWFEWTLCIDDTDPLFGSYRFLEREDCAAIKTDTRIDVSIFDDDVVSLLPPFLKENFARHTKLRAEFALANPHLVQSHDSG